MKTRVAFPVILNLYLSPDELSAIVEDRAKFINDRELHLIDADSEYGPQKAIQANVIGLEPD